MTPSSESDPHPPTCPAGRSTVRRVRFEHPAGFSLNWTPDRPELSAAANALSLMMPFVEPYVARSVRAALDDLEPPLAAEARRFVSQELQHQLQHQRLNAALREQAGGVARVEAWIRRTFGWLSSHLSFETSLAFAAATEAIAYSLARWTDARAGRLFDNADPHTMTMFMWHLAEEVEHKAVAIDVYRAVSGSRLRYLGAALLSLALLSYFTLIGTITMMASNKRLSSPVAWGRLVVWSVSLGFEVLPNLLLAVSSRHHPRDLADPISLTTWLSHFDPVTSTMPLWWTGAESVDECDGVLGTVVGGETGL